MSRSSLIDWLRAEGSLICSDIEVKDLPGRGRSVVCKNPIPKGRTLMAVKRRQLLNVQTIANPSWSKLSSHQQLALYIYLYRNTPEGYWYPFLSELPGIEGLQQIPLAFDPSASKPLPKQVQQRVNAQQQHFEDDLKAVTEFCANNISRDDFLSAWLCVNSRCLYMDMPNAQGDRFRPAGNRRQNNMTMAPFVDFFNHCEDENNSVAVTITAAGMNAISRVDYRPGDEIFLGYGPHDNTFLLCEYGFTIPGNRWNFVDATDEILTILTDPQKQLLQSVGYLGDYSTDGNGPSFRTEVALACAQDIPDRILRLIVDGLSDGDQYKPKSYAILKNILVQMRNTLNEQDVQQAHHDIFNDYIDTIDRSIDVINSFLT
jgi:hypothetical protein